MYHQLQKIGEEGLIAEIEYTIGDPEDDMPVIIKIAIGETVIPVGAFDLSRIEDMADKLLAGHDAVMQGLIDDARIDAYEANNDR
jgi:hypothetical protein